MSLQENMVTSSVLLYSSVPRNITELYNRGRYLELRNIVHYIHRITDECIWPSDECKIFIPSCLNSLPAPHTAAKFFSVCPIHHCCRTMTHTEEFTFIFFGTDEYRGGIYSSALYFSISSSVNQKI
jgi:hypothetical protein